VGGVWWTWRATPPPLTSISSRKLVESPRRCWGEEEEEREGEDKKKLIPRRPMRSQTINYRSLSVQESDSFRRKSLVNLKRGRTGEGGSYRFQAALRRDSVHELHPGWNSIRKLGRAVGRVQISRKTSLEKGMAARTPSPDPPTDLSDSISKSLLDKIGENDVNQIKLVFDSIDKNRDGQLSLAELEQFAANLCSSSGMESAGFTEQVKRLLHQMDEDRDGCVSFEEFTHYMAAISLLQASAPSQPATPNSAPSPAHAVLA
jgi:hypothetical protein